MRRGAIVRALEVRDLGAAVAELGPGPAWLDDGDADAERGDLLGDGLGEAFDAPFGGVVHGVAGEGDLPAIGGDLDDPPAALSQTRVTRVQARVYGQGSDRRTAPVRCVILRKYCW